VNGVDTSHLSDAVVHVQQLLLQFPDLEFIIQQNEETRALWQGLIDASIGNASPPPRNWSLLVDESKGTGAAPTSAWPSPPLDCTYAFGYAGGIGPHNVRAVLPEAAAAAQGRPFWIDMESSLRSIKNGVDVFDLDKCYAVVEAVCEMGFMQRPAYLPQSSSTTTTMTTEES